MQTQTQKKYYTRKIREFGSPVSLEVEKRHEQIYLLSRLMSFMMWIIYICHHVTSTYLARSIIKIASSPE
jgi:hypothetical protein